jgi:DNA-binding NtrC family response regulator
MAEKRQVKSSSRKRVLVVEDEADALEMLEAWLMTKGWDVRTARTGRAALEVSATFQPELLITDYFLQDDVTGVELIAQLKARGRKMRYVLLTGILQNALLEGAHRLHRIPILTKPVDFGRLWKLLS